LTQNSITVEQLFDYAWDPTPTATGWQVPCGVVSCSCSGDIAACYWGCQYTSWCSPIIISRPHQVPKRTSPSRLQQQQGQVSDTWAAALQLVSADAAPVLSLVCFWDHPRIRWQHECGDHGTGCLWPNHNVSPLNGTGRTTVPCLLAAMSTPVPCHVLLGMLQSLP